jgi:hypothetical protein
MKKPRELTLSKRRMKVRKKYKKTKMAEMPSQKTPDIWEKTKLSKELTAVLAYFGLLAGVVLIGSTFLITLARLTTMGWIQPKYAVWMLPASALCTFLWMMSVYLILEIGENWELRVRKYLIQSLM